MFFTRLKELYRMSNSRKFIFFKGTNITSTKIARLLNVFQFEYVGIITDVDNKTYEKLLKINLKIYSINKKKDNQDLIIIFEKKDIKETIEKIVSFNPELLIILNIDKNLSALEICNNHKFYMDNCEICFQFAFDEHLILVECLKKLYNKLFKMKLEKIIYDNDILNESNC